METSTKTFYLLSMMKNKKMTRIILSFAAISISISSNVLAQPHFLVADPLENYEMTVKTLGEIGAKITQSIPPQIYIVDIQNPAALTSKIKLLALYTGLIPQQDIKKMGIMERAAALEWNKQLLSHVKSQKTGAMSIMSQSVARMAINSPENLKSDVMTNRIRLSWQPGDGSLLTHLQISAHPQFSTLLFEAKTGLKSIDFPLHETPSPITLYARARTIERQDPSDKKSDVYGDWTTPTPIEQPVFQPKLEATPASPTSPIDEYLSNGFTVILEWSPGSSSLTQIQLSSQEEFHSPWLDTVVETQEFVVPSTALHVGEKNYWRIRSYGDIKSEWSTPRQFSIQEPQNHGIDVFVNPEAPQ